MALQKIAAMGEKLKKVGSVKFVGDALGELTVQTTNTDGSMRSLGDGQQEGKAGSTA